MDIELMLDVGQANELKLAFRRANWTNADIKKLCEGDVLSQLLSVVRGNAKVVVAKHIIDCDTDPFVPNGWKVEEHHKGGQLEWDPSKVTLYLSDGQKNGKVICGDKLREELKSQSVLNACVLDWLLAHPELIPEEWKGKAVFFWGTIFRNSDGFLSVRCLYWDGSQWYWLYDWLGHDWYEANPAAVRASSA